MITSDIAAVRTSFATGLASVVFSQSQTPRIGDELRRLRLNAGMSQEELAARARLSREYVSHIERGRYNPTVQVLIRLCSAMGVAAWEVVKRIEAPKS